VLEQELQAIRERCHKATRGPWGRYLVGENPDCEAGTKPDVFVTVGGRGFSLAEFERDEDADFVAHARTDIPLLLAEVGRLRSEPRLEFFVPPTSCVDLADPKQVERLVERVFSTPFDLPLTGAIMCSPTEHNFCDTQAGIICTRCGVSRDEVWPAKQKSLLDGVPVVETAREAGEVARRNVEALKHVS
jgi:hypothetical protein